MQGEQPDAQDGAPSTSAAAGAPDYVTEGNFGVEGAAAVRAAHAAADELEHEEIPQDLQDKVARKRWQNTRSARVSRARKATRLLELETQNSHLKDKVAWLEQETDRLRLKAGEPPLSESDFQQQQHKDDQSGPSTSLAPPGTQPSAQSVTSVDAPGEFDEPQALPFHEA